MNNSNPLPPKYSVLILTKNEADNLRSLLPQVDSVLMGLGCEFEKVIIDANSSDGTAQVAESLGARVFTQEGKGYGAAFREGIGKCRGEWILALDAGHSHPPAFLRSMIKNHEGAELLIASRYTPGGDANMEFYRNVLSRILGFVFGSCLGIPVKDVSSGYRIYKRNVVKNLNLVGRDFDILIETLIKLVSKGYKVREIPFIYEPRVFGSSNARLFKFAISYLRTLKSMWNLRNSVEAADYEERAYRSLIPLQRYWQRKRVSNIRQLADRDTFTIDTGSGASRATRALPSLLAIDFNLAPLRYLGGNGILVSQGNVEALPLADCSVKQIIFNNVIQDLPKESLFLKEISRVLVQGGRLIIGTPDYDSKLWQYLDRLHAFILPRASGSLSQSKYTRHELIGLLNSAGFKIERELDILGAERLYLAIEL